MPTTESRALLAALDAVTAMEASLAHQALTKRTETQNNRKPAQVQESE
jgi:hypothetical protein